MHFQISRVIYVEYLEINDTRMVEVIFELNNQGVYRILINKIEGNEIHLNYFGFDNPLEMGKYYDENVLSGNFDKPNSLWQPLIDGKIRDEIIRNLLEDEGVSIPFLFLRV